MVKLYCNSLWDAPSDCGPEARFVFEVLANWSDRSEVPAYGIKALAAKLHVAEKLVSGAVAELTQAGVLVRKDSKPEGRGRPAIRYMLTHDMLTAIQQRPKPYGIHSDILQRLFSGGEIKVEVPGSPPIETGARWKLTKGGRPPPSGVRGLLSAPNRLLLGALVANADRFGLVIGMSNQQLKRFTGLDDASLKHRLQRLVDLGLIRSFVPGLSSSIFTKGRVRSAYFINMNHTGLGVASVHAVMVHIADLKGRRMYSGLQILIDDVDHYKSGYREAKLITPAPVRAFLSGQNQRVFRVIQFMLSRYSSYLLSKHWSTIGSARQGQYDEVIEMISDDLRKPELNRDWGVIIEYFYRMAVELAEIVKSRFDRIAGTDLGAAEICLVPGPIDQGNKALTIFVLPMHRLPECILSEEGRGVMAPFRSGTESIIGLERRYELGLLTPPKASKRR